MASEAIPSFIGLGAGVASGLGVLARYSYRRFKQSGAREIESFGRYAGQGIKYYIGRYVRRQLAAEVTLRQYARLLLQSTAKEMLVPAAMPVHLNVDRVFIPLLLRDSLQEHIEHSDLLDRRGQRIMILGEPGSGKSSLFKRLFRDACRRAASSPRKAPVPVLFEMRHLAGGKDLTLNEFVDLLLSSLRTSAVYRSSKAVEDLSHGAGFFILLDGLDEVPSVLSVSLLRVLTQLSYYLSEIAPQSTVLISSRTQYFFSSHNRDLEEIFEVLSIQPFSLGNIYSFLEKWPFASSPKENITRIFSKLRQLPSLTEMCTNPLALAMFVARDQQTGGAELSETRSRFYDNLLEELIVNRRSRGEGLSVGRQRLRDIRRAIPGPVCLEHLLAHDEIANSIPRQRFIRAIEAIGYGGPDPATALDQLSIDTGLFVEERTGETIRFLHLTLCEFLAAVEVTESSDAGWTKLFTPMHGFGRDVPFWESRLSEVVAFSCGIANRSLKKRILSDLSKNKRPELLLRPIMEAQSYDQEIAVHAIRSECQYILNQEPSAWDAQWFTRLRVILTILRDASTGERAELFKSRQDLPDGPHLVMKLIERYQAEDQLLGTLARQDADAAIGIAETTNRRDLMDHVAAAADDFSVMQGILGRCEKGIAAWQAALVERALVDGNIARLLYSIPHGHLSSQGNLKVTGRWAKTWVMDNSIYGALLDNVLRDTYSCSQRMRPLLVQMSRIRPPRLEIFSITRGLWLPLSLMLTAFAVLLIEGSHNTSRILSDATSGLVLTIGMVFLFLGPLRELVSRERFRRIYIAVKMDETSEVMIRGSVEGPNPSKIHMLEERLRSVRDYLVLREIVNVRSYRFSQIDSVSGSNVNISKKAKRAVFIAGCSQNDLRCIMMARKLRNSMASKVVGDPPDRAETAAY
jgi:hypothetical protein